MKKFCETCGHKLVLGEEYKFNSETGKPVFNKCPNLKCKTNCDKRNHKYEYLYKKHCYGQTYLGWKCLDCKVFHDCLMNDKEDCLLS